MGIAALWPLASRAIAARGLGGYSVSKKPSHLGRKQLVPGYYEA
jgi:hypothetical protein